MNSTPLIHDAEHWRRRAKEARRIADELDNVAKQTMLEIAQSYERLAELAEQRTITPASEK